MGKLELNDESQRMKWFMIVNRSSHQQTIASQREAGASNQTLNYHCHNGSAAQLMPARATPSAKASPKASQILSILFLLIVIGLVLNLKSREYVLDGVSSNITFDNGNSNDFKVFVGMVVAMLVFVFFVFLHFQTKWFQECFIWKTENIRRGIEIFSHSS